MFKRVERKRKRREEEAELGLDEDTKEMMGLNDTDSDESDSGSERELCARSNSEESVPNFGEDEDEDTIENPPMSIEEALKDPIFLVSLDPTVHGCVMCRGKLIKNAGMATAHRSAKVHKRRFELFRRLSADADPRSSAWELVKATRSAPSVQKIGPQELSKRALKRQAKQVAIREKRKHHKELKAKAIMKKAERKRSTVGSAVPSQANMQCSQELQNQSGTTRKKQKLESKTSASKTRDITGKSASRTRTSSESKTTVFETGIKNTRKANKPS